LDFLNHILTSTGMIVYLYSSDMSGTKANVASLPSAAFSIISINAGWTMTPATANAKNTLLINFLAADTATRIGKKKNGASPIVFKMLYVELSSDNTPVILNN